MLEISLIVPVYNRPDEILALLQSLLVQSDPSFEIIVVEDGSDISCETIVRSFENQLNVSYYFKGNSGPGLSRNFGATKAKGNYLIFFDSDCIIPPAYIANVKRQLSSHYTDAFGGPDKAHFSFSSIQKAIDYSMTSFFTTGGIRGKKKGMEKFHPRSFNMGFSKEVFSKTGGFSAMRFGEDVDLSIRIFEAGYSVQLIEEAFVFHKRRTDLKKFFKQVYNSGIARIHLYQLHPNSLKLVHFLPSLFLTGTLLLVLLSIYKITFLFPIWVFFFIIVVDALRSTRDLKVALLSIAASFIQLIGYGAGFIAGCWHRLVLKKKDFQAFSKTFYK